MYEGSRKLYFLFLTVWNRVEYPEDSGETGSYYNENTA
jgi:hypothetical protein